MEPVTGDDFLDRSVRRYVYTHFVEQERPPTVEETAAVLKLPATAVEAAFKRLHENRILVLEPGRLEIRFAEPFCAVPTRFKVAVKGQSWWGTCAWDALGIPAALHAEAEIASSCPDCEEPLNLSVRNGKVNGSEAIIHFAVPAKRWWDDIFIT